MKRLIIVLVMLSVGLNLSARPNRGITPRTKNQKQIDRTSSWGNTCSPASQSTDLDINNVRTKILNGGDMWWDLNNPKYEVPKVNDPNAVRKHSLFSGALWIGGKDNGGNLKLAAMTYRQRGSDFWPGPLDTTTSSTEPIRCETYDRLWKITRSDLEEAKEDPSAATEDIQSWPASFNRITRTGNEARYLAPYLDVDGAPGYNYLNGDHPVLDHRRPANENGVSAQPDMFIWFVYNDRGNIHSETQGSPMGLEIQTTAFAYATNDEINNMTFYTSQLTNRGFNDIVDCYMGQWVDADLGNYSDDYVGCDVGRSLGYCYNGDDDDEGVLGYGLNPPTVGVDYFEGPTDNGTELGLSTFMYYNNDSDPIRGNPDVAIEFYNLLQGKWLGGQNVTFGGNGLGGSQQTKYMFSGGTDPDFPGQCWDEKSAGNQPADRRFLQSTGPFKMGAGESQRITTGVVWARTTSGGAGAPCNSSAQGSLSILKLASDKAQTLFNNNFKILDGPDAPDIEIQELESELVLKILNASSDKVENYEETYKDALNKEKSYKFEGYVIYQLKDATVNTGDLENVDKARLLFQSDVKNKRAQIINKVFDPKLNTLIPVEKVDGANEGITHTYSIKNDLFSKSSNTSLVDFKTYYYMILSYAAISNDTLQVDPEQYLAGRRNIKVYKGVPHKTESENFGTKLNSSFGSGPTITQVEGRGNGGNILELSKESIEKILKDGIDPTPTYIAGSGPVKVKVVDPLKVPVADFELIFNENRATTAVQNKDSISANTSWTLINITSGDTIFSDTTLQYKFESTQGVRSLSNPSELTLADWGLSVEIEQVKNPGEDATADQGNGLLDWSVEWEDNGRQWLTAIVDNDQQNQPTSGAIWTNWIRAGGFGRGSTFDPLYHDHFLSISPNVDPIDPTGGFEKIWNGRIAPYVLAARDNGTPGRNTYGPAAFIGGIQSPKLDHSLSQISSFQLIITPDKSLWTKCPVIEMGEPEVRLGTQGSIFKMSARAGVSVDKDGNTTSGTGLGWFPGYAIDLETGERLQLAFGEDSYLQGENGRDMIWNPTSTVYNDNGNYPAIGGKHYIYIFGNNWGGVNKLRSGFRYLGEENNSYTDWLNELTTLNNSDKRKGWDNCMWIIPTYLANGYNMDDGVPPTEVKFTVHVKKAYTTRLAPGQTATNNQRPKYTFNTADIAPTINNEEGIKSLDLANVVPNPYRVYSQYETSPIDSRVKITNLPPEATISIYDMAGNFVRRFNKADELTYLDWDLKNQSSVPIASGLYLIHIKTKDLGEKIIKWYGIMHEIDLDTY